MAKYNVSINIHKSNLCSDLVPHGLFFVGILALFSACNSFKRCIDYKRSHLFCISRNRGSGSTTLLLISSDRCQVPWPSGTRNSLRINSFRLKRWYAVISRRSLAVKEEATGHTGLSWSEQSGALTKHKHTHTHTASQGWTLAQCVKREINPNTGNGFVLGHALIFLASWCIVHNNVCKYKVQRLFFFFAINVCKWDAAHHRIHFDSAEGGAAHSPAVTFSTLSFASLQTTASSYTKTTNTNEDETCFRVQSLRWRMKNGKRECGLLIIMPESRHVMSHANTNSISPSSCYLTRLLLFSLKDWTSGRLAAMALRLTLHPVTTAFNPLLYQQGLSPVWAPDTAPFPPQGARTAFHETNRRQRDGNLELYWHLQCEIKLTSAKSLSHSTASLLTKSSSLLVSLLKENKTSKSENLYLTV